MFGSRPFTSVGLRTLVRKTHFALVLNLPEKLHIFSGRRSAMLGETLANTMYVHAQSKKVIKLPNGKERLESEFPARIFAQLVELPNQPAPAAVNMLPAPQAPVQDGEPVQGAVEVEGEVLGPGN